MEDPKNFVNQPELNAFNDYYSQTDSNYDPNREKNITNKAKETIKNFKNQYLMTNDNNQRILPTEINQNQNAQNYSYQILPMSNKVREDMNSYDYFFGGNKNGNRSITPSNNKNEMRNEKVEHNIDLISQENNKLKKQVMDLVLENKNLQNKINNNYPSPILVKDNNFNNFNSINRQEPFFKTESENNMNFNNIMNVPLNDKKFLEESIESVIKTNMKLGQNNNEMKKNLYELKKYGNYKMGSKRTPNYKQNNYNMNNYNFNNMNINSNENNYPYSNYNQNINNNNEKYFSIINDYNQLMESYKAAKIKNDSLQQELENRKGLANKYRILSNNYLDLQNRNKELIITIQKMKNDNSVLTRHIDNLNKQKKSVENNLYKLKNKNANVNNNENSKNIHELKVLKNKYTELQKYIEDIMKEKQDSDKNERKKNKFKN